MPETLTFEAIGRTWVIDETAQVRDTYGCSPSILDERQIVDALVAAAAQKLGIINATQQTVIWTQHMTSFDRMLARIVAIRHHMMMR